MRGDIDDFTARLRAALPEGWFGDVAPVRDTLLAGPSQIGAWLYDLLAYTAQQMRLLTASGIALDAIAADFFGESLLRGAGQTDGSFRAAIIANLFRERGTRQAVVRILQDITGNTPTVFEPTRPLDTGAYGIGYGYGLAGGWGSMLLPDTAFVRIRRRVGDGIPYVAGYGTPSGGYGRASRAAYVSLQQIADQVRDADIYAAVDAVRPVGTTVWVQIAS